MNASVTKSLRSLWFNIVWAPYGRWPMIIAFIPTRHNVSRIPSQRQLNYPLIDKFFFCFASQGFFMCSDLLHLLRWRVHFYFESLLVILYNLFLLWSQEDEVGTISVAYQKNVKRLQPQSNKRWTTDTVELLRASSYRKWFFLILLSIGDLFLYYM